MTNEELDRVEHYFRSLMSMKLGDSRLETKNQIAHILRNQVEKQRVIEKEAQSMVFGLLKEIRRLQEENQRLKEAYEANGMMILKEATE